MDFVYSKIRVSKDIEIETVTGGNRYSGKVWLEIARQIYCEHGEDYREIGHFQSGAPFLFSDNHKISISHTKGCLAVASLKVDEEADLSKFDYATLLGVDVEKADREKAASLRERFLDESEFELAPEGDIEKCIIAWTAKEAMYKAALTPGINWHHDLLIKKLPSPGKPGEGVIIIGEKEYPVKLETFREEDYFITVTCSTLSPTYQR